MNNFVADKLYKVPKKKLKQFAENITFPNLFQLTYEEIENGFFLKGKWNNEFFKNDKSIVLELGCGKGEYTVGLARKSLESNFIGIDMKGARLWRGCKTSLEENLQNVAFIRTKVELLEHFFDENEIREIWITFPDPQPKERKFRKRLISPRFLKIYQKILAPGGIIHLKTDNDVFYRYTEDVVKENGLNVIYNTGDLYNSDFDGEAREITTYYEEMYLKQRIPIKYMKFSFN